MYAQILMLISAGILLVLGSIHLVYTFFGTKFMPREPALIERMQQVSPVITTQTTMWRCWTGFNASHSMGAMLFGLVYGYLGFVHSELLFGSMFLIGVGVLMLGGLFELARRYWFSVPRAGISIALLSYVASIAVALF